MLIQIIKYLQFIKPIHIILFGLFSFGLVFSLVPIYKYFSKQSKIIQKSYLLSKLDFVDLNKGYRTKFPIVDRCFLDIPSVRSVSLRTYKTKSVTLALYEIQSVTLKYI